MAGRLTAQEMQELRREVARAVARDPRASDDRRSQAAKATVKTPTAVRSTPMTRVYRRVDAEAEAVSAAQRPARKTLASIQYERQFVGAEVVGAATKGIDASAKAVLQDEYVTRPRDVSVIPKRLSNGENSSNGGGERTGRRAAPAAIQQVFLC